uniref:SERPIN domain-containing protein n=1 Tax=Rhabditophanes sp. KR3021 TaxID=114890 RepID=A0AC35U9E9_9BILA
MSRASASESSDDGELMNDNTGETVGFEFEAFPIEENNTQAIHNLLTQIFLKSTALDVEGLAKFIAHNSANLGHVIQLAEDAVADDEDVETIFAVCTIVDITGNDNESKMKLREFIQGRLQKSEATGSTKTSIQTLLACDKLSLWINERWLNIPKALAVSSVQNLLTEADNLKGMKDRELCYFMKIYTNDGKQIAKKSSKVLFANPEEEHLFNAVKSYPYFDYNVSGEVDPDSKFASKVVDGVVYQPARRIVFFPYKELENISVVIQIEE